MAQRHNVCAGVIAHRDSKPDKGGPGSRGMRSFALLAVLLFPLASAHGGEVPAELLPLGDIDGDGMADVLRAGNGTLTALAGPHLKTPLWHAHADGWMAGRGPDVDSDGVLDPMVWNGSGQGSGGVTGVGPAWLRTSSWQGDDRVLHLSGRSGEPVADLRFGYQHDGTSVGASAPGVFADVDRSTWSWSGGAVVSARQALSVHATGEGARAFAYAGTFLWQSVALETLTVRSTTPQGTLLAEASYEDPLYAVTGMGVADLDADGYVDVVVLESLREAGAPVAIEHDRVTAWSGRDGALLWSLEEEPAVGSAWRYVWYYALGDLDGDGSQDIVEVEWAEGTSTRLLSGADGSEIGRRQTSPDSDGFGLPWIDTDGDGKDEYLWVEYSWMDEGIALEVAGLGGSLWSQKLDSFAEPLDLQIDPSGLNASFRDWTGDGVPDLALATWSERPQAVLVDGSDGALLHKMDLGEGAWSVVDDLTGDALPDLVLVSLTDEDGDPARGDRNATATVEARRGTDGELAWRRVVMEPGAGDVMDADVRAGPVGDVDGDGAGDVWVHIGSWGREEEIMFEELRMAEAPEASFRLDIVLSGAAGRVLWSDSQDAMEMESSLPSIQAGKAIVAVPPAEDPSIPVAPWLPLVALGAVLHRLKRR